MFRYLATTDSTPGVGRDLITDWQAGYKIDLSALDAAASQSGLQHFVFGGEGPVSRAVGEGEVKYYHAFGNTYVIAGTDGSGTATLQIEIAGTQTLTLDNFVGVGARTVGTDAADTLVGTAADETFLGKGERDVLTGGGGHDTFVFNAASESGPGIARDTITDWNNGDILDLAGIDGSSTLAGFQHLHYVGQGPVTRAVGEGEVKWYQAYGNTYVTAGTDPSGTATLQVELLGLHTLTDQNFHL